MEEGGGRRLEEEEGAPNPNCDRLAWVIGRLDCDRGELGLGIIV